MGNPKCSLCTTTMVGAFTQKTLHHDTVTCLKELRAILGIRSAVINKMTSEIRVPSMLEQISTTFKRRSLVSKLISSQETVARKWTLKRISARAFSGSNQQFISTSCLRSLIPLLVESS
jgi:hypothetical protein